MRLCLRRDHPVAVLGDLTSYWVGLNSVVKWFPPPKFETRYLSSQCMCGCDLPVELIDILYVSEQGTHLFWTYGKVTHIDNVSQVVLENSRTTESCIKGNITICWRVTLYRYFQIPTSRGSMYTEKHTSSHALWCMFDVHKTFGLSPTFAEIQRMKNHLMCVNADVLDFFKKAGSRNSDSLDVILTGSLRICSTD